MSQLNLLMEKKDKNTISVGSVCSGIEAASVAWEGNGYHFEWFSEISDFPSRVLELKYPKIFNLGDMCNIPELLKSKKVVAPDLICGGTPCQAFSFAGWKKGLEDDRGNLTLKFVDIVNQNDKLRLKSGAKETIVFWENVEGVLKDKTNAFGCFLSSLLGLDEELSISRWPSSGVIHGPKRNVAWRVLDAKYFGLPHQRKRLYVLAGGKDFYPENIMFDKLLGEVPTYEAPLKFKKSGQSIEVFRSYTDCLYSAYGTKWNGNAAAYNGSLFVAQNERLRRLTPLECERLMGFPDYYTDIPKARPTNRYQAVGNSWAVPVIKWFGNRINNVYNQKKCKSVFLTSHPEIAGLSHNDHRSIRSYSTLCKEAKRLLINGTDVVENPKIGNLKDIIDLDPPEKFFISPVGCKGILRRKVERNKNINERLEYYLELISSQMCEKEIERRSRVQKRGRFSTPSDLNLQ